jgi:hypothetical protein
MNNEVVGCPSVMNDGLFQIVNQKILKDDTSQFQNYHESFHKLHALLSTTFTIVRLSYHMFWARWVLKIHMDAH